MGFRYQFPDHSVEFKKIEYVRVIRLEDVALVFGVMRCDNESTHVLRGDRCSGS